MYFPLQKQQPCKQNTVDYVQTIKNVIVLVYMCFCKTSGNRVLFHEMPFEIFNFAEVIFKIKLTLFQ